MLLTVLDYQSHEISPEVKHKAYNWLRYLYEGEMIKLTDSQVVQVYHLDSFSDEQKIMMAIQACEEENLLNQKDYVYSFQKQTILCIMK